MKQYCKNCGFEFEKAFGKTGSCPICSASHSFGDEFVGFPGGLPDYTDHGHTPEEINQIVKAVTEKFPKTKKKKEPKN